MLTRLVLVTLALSAFPSLARDAEASSGFSPPAVRGSNCVLCKTIVTEMFKFLRENRTEEDIRENLDKICSIVFSRSPPKMKECEDMVATYSREIVDMLVEETSPELICMLLDQCTYNSEANQIAERVSMGQFISTLDPSIPANSKRTCVECKLFIEYIQSTLSSAISEREVKEWLIRDLCDSFVDKSIRKTCIDLITTYTHVFFKAIIKELDPKTACVQLHACDASRFQTLTVDNTPLVSRPKVLPPSSDGQQEVKLKESLCDQCCDIVTKIDEYLSSHPLDHDVSVLIDQVCNKIPNDSAKNECIFLIRTFGQEIAQAISTMDNPRQLCSRLMLC